MGLDVEIDAEAEDADAVAAKLRELRSELARDPDAEIWVRHGEYPALCALVSGEAGWLMYLRHDGDAGLRSRNPDFPGDPGETLRFVLGNGQVDRHPASWTYPTGVVLAALEQFAATREVPPQIRWHDDSLDGPGWGP